jgi:predicted Zn finger-like uncharacterized protein
LIVSCESCKSRYKIDDSKISGRGARITCPRCKHQFVVYTADKNAGPSVVSQQNSDWDDEPTRVGAKKGEKSRPSTPPAVGNATESIGERPTEMSPTMTGTPTGMSPISAAALAAQMRAPPPEDEPSGAGYEVSSRQIQRLSPAEAAARASLLDFRKVGINAWKVKVKIGLIYDFSDLKTLRKYIQDARVTPADLISHDGKSWRAIGDIPDLDVYFVETYDQLFADQAARPPEEPKPKPSADTSTLDASRSFEEEMDSKRTRARPLPASQRNTPQKPPDTGGSNTGMMVGIGLMVALVLAGGIWYATQGPGGQPPPLTPVQAPPSTVDQKSIREGIIKNMTPTEAPQDPPTTLDPKLIVPTLTPVGPRGTPPPVGSPGGVSPGNSTVSQKDSTASDFLEAGASAERAGRWAEAVVAYSQASKKEPRNASIRVRLGVAQYNAKDMSGAQSSLESAISLGAKGESLRVLGDIYAANGDVAGARDYYQRYLAGNPRDKVAVELKLKQLNGG